MSFTQTQSAAIEHRYATSGPQTASQRTYEHRDIVSDVLLLGSVGKPDFLDGLDNSARVGAAFPPLALQAVYNGGHEDAKNIYLLIATRDAVHSRHIEALANGFINYSVDNGSKPFLVEWYVGDPTDGGTRAIRYVDITITYDGAAENQLTSNGASVLRICCACGRCKDDEKDPARLALAFFLNPSPNCSGTGESFIAWVVSVDGGQRVIRELQKNGHVLYSEAPDQSLEGRAWDETSVITDSSWL